MSGTVLFKIAQCRDKSVLASFLAAMVRMRPVAKIRHWPKAAASSSSKHRFSIQKTRPPAEAAYLNSTIHAMRPSAITAFEGVKLAIIGIGRCASEPVPLYSQMVLLLLYAARDCLAHPFRTVSNTRKSTLN
jgi:hypothetical protein